jgi:hypothetical protein
VRLGPGPGSMNCGRTSLALLLPSKIPPEQIWSGLLLATTPPQPLLAFLPSSVWNGALPVLLPGTNEVKCCCSRGANAERSVVQYLCICLNVPVQCDTGQEHGTLVMSDVKGSHACQVQTATSTTSATSIANRLAPQTAETVCCWKLDCRSTQPSCNVQQAQANRPTSRCASSPPASWVTLER